VEKGLLGGKYRERKEGGGGMVDRCVNVVASHIGRGEGRRREEEEEERSRGGYPSVGM